ncbi:RNA demethylase ALKBH9B-like isoform X2 [Euphorbia lathyris]
MQESQSADVTYRSVLKSLDLGKTTSRSEILRVMDNGIMSEEQKEEQIRFSNVGRKKNFSYVERVNGKSTNVLEGLQLHTKVFNAQEQKKIVECVYNLQNSGRKGHLRERTYSEPKKWMRGKGRVTMQFGCCYNYAVDKNGNPPGIIRDEEVDPLPPVFKQMIKRMIRWHVLPATCIPNSCIVNIYDEGDCIPPHIDHHDFLRPFCTVSFLTECNILFGSNLKIIGPGEFSGPAFIPLPVGSVLVLNGNGADVSKHCVPGVPSRRISITFRKMDDSKMPYKFLPDPELMGLKPLRYSLSNKSPYQQPQVLNCHSAAKSTVPPKSPEKESESKSSAPLPVRSVIVLNGNDADVAKHCVPGVPSTRISITFGKMDDTKKPYKFSPDPELMGMKPLGYSLSNKSAAKSTVPQMNPEKESESKSSIPLHVGSVIVLNGNGADVAKHCVPGVPSRRRMDDTKMPYKSSPHRELMEIKPLGYSLLNKSPYQQPQVLNYRSAVKSTVPRMSPVKESQSKSSFILGKEDFPTLASLNLSSRSRVNKSRSRQY